MNHPHYAPPLHSSQQIQRPTPSELDQDDDLFDPLHTIENPQFDNHNHPKMNPPNSLFMGTYSTSLPDLDTPGGGFVGGELNVVPKMITNYSGIYTREEVLALHRMDYKIPDSFPSDEDIASKTPLKPVASFKYNRREFDSSGAGEYNSSEGNFFGRGSGRSKGGRGRGRGRRGDPYGGWEDDDKVYARGGSTSRGRGLTHKTDEKPWRKKDEETFGSDMVHPSTGKPSTGNPDTPSSAGKKPSYPNWENPDPKIQPIPSSQTPANTPIGTVPESSVTNPSNPSKTWASVSTPDLPSTTGAHTGPSDNYVPNIVEAFAANLNPQSSGGVDFHGSAGSEPATKWFYKDPKGQEHGPYVSIQMEKWLKHNFFKADLFVRRERDPIYVPLGFYFLAEQRNPFSGLPLGQWLPTASADFKNGLMYLQNQQRNELIARQEQMLRTQQLQQLLQSVKLDSSGQQPQQQSDGPIFGPSKPLANTAAAAAGMSVPHSHTSPSIPSPSVSGVSGSNPVVGGHLRAASGNLNPLMSPQAAPSPLASLQAGQFGGDPNLGQHQNINTGGPSPYNWNTIWSQQNQQPYLHLMRLQQLYMQQQQQQQRGGIPGNDPNFLNELVNKDPKLSEHGVSLTGSSSSISKPGSENIKSDKLLNPIAGNIMMNQAKLKTGSVPKDNPQILSAVPSSLDPSFPPKSKSSPWINPPLSSPVVDAPPHPSQLDQLHLHKSELIEKSRFMGDPQQQQQILQQMANLPKTPTNPSAPMVVQPPYSLNTLPGRGPPLWPNYSTENKPPLSPWTTSDPSTSIWYNGPVGTQASSSNVWKSTTTTSSMAAAEDSGGGWKHTEQPQQRSSIQDEQNKTLREIVAQMNQVKNNPISTLVGLENKEEPRDELKQSRSNIYPEQQDRSAIQQPQQQSYSTPKHLLQQLQQLQIQQQQQQQLQQLQIQQQQQQQQQQLQLQQQLQMQSQQQASVLNQSGSSAWKTLSSKDIPKSFIDIQKEEEQQKISRDHESPWGAVKANDPIRRDDTKKPTQPPYNMDQQPPPQQPPQQYQQSKRPANQKQQHQPPHSGTGNRNNMKHSK